MCMNFHHEQHIHLCILTITRSDRNLPLGSSFLIVFLLLLWYCKGSKVDTTDAPGNVIAVRIIGAYCSTAFFSHDIKSKECMILDRNILPELFLTFFKIGLFTFGGGYAMIPIIENICVERKQWITHEDMMQVTVIAESTPGPIAINCATYVGYKKRGFPGAVAATLGVVLPSFLLIYIISMYLDSFLEFTVIANAFKGIKIAVGVLIVNAGFNMLKSVPKTRLARIILLGAFSAMICIELFSLNFSTISLLLIAAAVSLAALCNEKKGGEGA